ncbi:MAG: Integral membrane protein, partial [uncultured Nocardioidaceae bacterium]
DESAASRGRPGPRPALPPPRAPADAAVRRAGALRRLDGADGPLGARRDALGRAAPGAGRPARLVVRHRDHRRRGARAALLDPVARAPRSRDGEQRPRRRDRGGRRARGAAVTRPARGADRLRSRRHPAQRRRDRRLHRGPPGAGTSRRTDDRAGAAHRGLGPVGPHRDRGRGGAARHRARGDARGRDRRLRARDRPVGPAPVAPAPGAAPGRSDM